MHKLVFKNVHRNLTDELAKYYKDCEFHEELSEDEILPEYLNAFKKFLLAVGFGGDLEIVARYRDSETEVSSDEYLS